MKYKSTFKVSVNFTPWFDTGYRLEYLKLYEELGGKLPSGRIVLSSDASQKGLELYSKEYTGHLTIEKEGGVTHEIDLFIHTRSIKKNTVTLEFICVPDNKFFTEKITLTHDDITNTITSLYPGKQDIRCETDIQGGDIKFYQNAETNADLLTRLCMSFKKQSIFAFGWEGLLIKDTVGKDSQDNDEPYMIYMGDFCNNSQEKDGQLDPFIEKYNPEFYNLPYNSWEDSESKRVVKDYTDLEPINIRPLTRFGNTMYVQTPYQVLYENMCYNSIYYNSSYFHSFRIVADSIPSYKLGDVLIYKRNEQVKSEKTWPYQYYLVRSNELFISADGCDMRDFRGNKFSFLSKFVSIEKDGSIELGKDKEDDPTETEE